MQTQFEDKTVLVTGGGGGIGRAAAQMHPVGRLGEAEEVAAVVLWLCSDAASFVTGHAHTVDGDLTAV